MGSTPLLAIFALVRELVAVKRRGGRLFVLGNGGGAAHATHAAADFRKLAGIESYAPHDNFAQLTARVNDDGWDNAYVGWLKVSRLSPVDLVLVISVGGGDAARSLSGNLVAAVRLAKHRGAPVCGIVGRDGGATAQLADACVIVPTVNPGQVTAHVEGMQAVLLHLLVTHPDLAETTPTWESRTVESR